MIMLFVFILVIVNLNQICAMPTLKEKIVLV
jgi:hypothetical protein